MSRGKSTRAFGAANLGALKQMRLPKKATKKKVPAKRTATTTDRRATLSEVRSAIRRGGYAELSKLNRKPRHDGPGNH